MSMSSLKLYRHFGSMASDRSGDQHGRAGHLARIMSLDHMRRLHARNWLLGRDPYAERPCIGQSWSISAHPCERGRTRRVVENEPWDHGRNHVPQRARSDLDTSARTVFFGPVAEREMEIGHDIPAATENPRQGFSSGNRLVRV